MKNELVVKVIGSKWESAPEQKEEHIWTSDACFLLMTLSYYTHLVWIWSRFYFYYVGSPVGRATEGRWNVITASSSKRVCPFRVGWEPEKPCPRIPSHCEVICFFIIPDQWHDDPASPKPTKQKSQLMRY